jgi:peroxiredoxin
MITNLQMKPVLEPGMRLPDMKQLIQGALAAALNDPSKNIIVIFFPLNPNGNTASKLAELGSRLADLQDAMVVGVSDDEPGNLAKLAHEKNISFPLLSDRSKSFCATCGVLASDNTVSPTVFIADGERLVRRIYKASEYPDLPNSGAVARAVTKLQAVPKPIPMSEEDWQKGNPRAPVVMIEYSDYQCHHCAELYEIIKRDIFPAFATQLLIVHGHLYLPATHPLARKAAEAAEASGSQGKFWEMHARLFESHCQLERENLIQYAREIGLDVDKFIADVDTDRYREVVYADFQSAVRNKIKLPPPCSSIVFCGKVHGQARRLAHGLVACLHASHPLDKIHFRIN